MAAIGGNYRIRYLSLVVIRLLIRDVEITNVEKIQEASSIAEQSLDYVVNEVPVGIITYNGKHAR